LSYTPRYDKGNWLADCDVCGRKYKASALQQRWDGLMCCPDDWEIRQPQDFVRGIPDTQIAPWLRPEPNDSFIFVCTPITNQGIADYGVADCAQADINYGLLPACTLDGSSCVAGYAVSGCSITGNIPMGWDLDL
jgi:hypothetical protein